MAYGTFVQLAASVNDIDTSDNLIGFSAFERGIILNGGNKKVIDPVNSKITTAAVGTHPPDPGTVLTGGSSGAVMVTDYITALSGACTIYGRKRTETTFTSGETVTGTDDDGNSISFTLNAAETTPSPAHWYDFTVFGNSSTFGELPATLYLGALFLGRLYVGGYPSLSHEWWASRQGSIHDFLFNAGDVQSACAGQDIEFGRIGDIPRAFIPNGNDYLLFGCQSSMYALIGDPLQGGTGRRVSAEIGVFGSDSWCYDDQFNLWFWGQDGVYKMHAGSFTIEHMTGYRLPRIVTEEAVDPSTHRICLKYDFERKGLVVAITNLSTRVNSAYWWEKRLDAWYPESYPISCSPYSMLYHDAATVANRGLLFGCSDGYVRQFDESEKNDDTGASETAIDSFVVFGPFALNDKLGGEGTIGDVHGILAGGGTGGSKTDSSNVTYYIYVAESPEKVIEKIDAGTYSLTGTLYAPGYVKGRKDHRKIRGQYGAIKLQNNTASQSWGFEEIEVDVTPIGGI